MRQFQTRVGFRWRCLRSIEAAGRPSGERDAFGREQTDFNRYVDQIGDQYQRWRNEFQGGQRRR